MDIYASNNKQLSKGSNYMNFQDKQKHNNNKRF